MILWVLMCALYIIMNMSCGISFYLFWLGAGVVGVIIVVLSEFVKGRYKLKDIGWKECTWAVLGVLLGCIMFWFAIENLDYEVKNV